MKIDLATVVYYEELNFLETQARSIELYVPSENIGTIYVIINQESGSCDVDPSWYGVNADKVKVIDYHDWGYSNYNEQYSHRPGWQNQQLCKLLIAKESNTEWYAVLDAKTWFVNPLDLSRLFTDNKYHARLIRWHGNFHESVKSINLQFSIDMKDTIAPAGVPFFFHRQTVLDMMEYIETVANPDETFHDFFLLRSRVENPGFITEFCLYSGYIIFKYQNFDHLYYIGTTNYTLTPVNIDVYNIPKSIHRIDKLLDDMHDPKTVTASIHRNTIARLSPRQLRRWLDFLEERNLVDSK